MTQSEFEKLSIELQKLSKEIPLNWGKVQNNTTDSKINMFAFSNIEELNEGIQFLKPEDQNYFKRRWFIWMCSKLDEYLFYKEVNVEKNPISKDKSWDIEFNREHKFDVKGTVVPKSFRNDFSISLEKEIIDFYYKKQSTGVRFHIQNRLFIVHHSFYKNERSMFLRCHWKLKEKAYKTFNTLLTESKLNLVNYEDVFAKCIFILENKNNEFYFKIN